MGNELDAVRDMAAERIAKERVAIDNAPDVRPMHTEPKLTARRAWLPTWIISSPVLTPLEKALYSVLSIAVGDVVSIAWLSEILGTDGRTVRRALASMNEKGQLHTLVSVGDGRYRVGLLDLPPEALVVERHTKPDQPTVFCPDDRSVVTLTTSMSEGSSDVAGNGVPRAKPIHAPGQTDPSTPGQTDPLTRAKPIHQSDRERQREKETETNVAA